MRAIGGDVMDFNPASWPCQPLLDHKSVVVLGIVEKDVDQFLRGIHKRDGNQECDRAHSINRQHFDHTGLTRFQINGSMNVQALPPAGLFNHNFLVFWRPTARRPHLVRRMYRIGENYGFIIAEVIEQILISFDKGFLFFGVELARYYLRLAIFNAYPVQKLDESRASVADAAGLLDRFP